MTASARGDDVPLSGTIAVAAGQAALVRVPVPGTAGLAVEFWAPRGYAGPSTSSLFIQDVAGRRALRLDYGRNARLGNAVDYHWNQDRVFREFRVADQTSVGRVGALAYRAARAYRWAGSALVVVGASVDFVSIVRASQRLRRASEVVSAWALAWAGCRTVGAGGAALGTLVEPGLGTAGGAVLGCIVGGGAGYKAGESLGGAVYDWGHGTLFTRLPEIPVG